MTLKYPRRSELETPSQGFVLLYLRFETGRTFSPGTLYLPLHFVFRKFTFGNIMNFYEN